MTDEKVSLLQQDGELEIVPVNKSVRNSSIRWLMLCLSCFFMMGSYFCYDNPTVIETTLKDEPYDFSGQQYNALFEVYSLPNMFLPLFGGVFLDKIGIR